jgi:hypothetical protein
MTDLLVAPCDTKAATYAVLNWHYSKVMPTGKIVKYGVWEDKKFIGAVLYGRGASPHLGTALDLDATEVCELVRVALTTHKTPVSQIVARTLTELRKTQPGLRLVVSFADPKEGHRGGIYQAGNWIYTGRSNPVTEYFIDGRWRHTRGAYHHPNRKTAPMREAPGKYRYLYPLDKAMRRKITRLALPYPGGSGLNSETLSSPERRSGAIPENRSTQPD